MKFEKKESSPCVVALSVKADAEEIKGEYQKVLNAFLRQAVIPGFRKGKVPLPVIKQKFQQEIAQESQQACFRALYPQALKESGLEEAAVNLQNVTDILFTPEAGFSFTAHVEVKPEFDLPKYKKLALKKGDVSVSEEPRSPTRRRRRLSTSCPTRRPSAPQRAFGPRSRTAASCPRSSMRSRA